MLTRLVTLGDRPRSRRHIRTPHRTIGSGYLLIWVILEIQFRERWSLTDAPVCVVFNPTRRVLIDRFLSLVRDQHLGRGET